MILLLFPAKQIFAQEFDILADKVIEKDFDGIKELLSQGINLNVKEKSKSSTVLMLACSYAGFEDMVEFLILNGADVNAADKNGKTPLIWAASNSLESARLLISHGAKVNHRANDGMTAFIQSVFGVISGKVPIEICGLISENGGDINATLTGNSANGWSSLHYAAMNGDVELVNYLIKHGANVNKATAEGSTPLFLARIEGYDEIVKILKRAGARE